jgi:hypothetical protein
MGKPNPRKSSHTFIDTTSRQAPHQPLQTANMLPTTGEPRRSGRATKGQHTKLDLEPVPVVAPVPVAPKRGGKKGSKSKQSASEEPDDEEEDSIIRCVCGATEDEEGWMMICCEQCLAWQHNLCMGVSEEEDHIPEVYYCEQCKPENHKALLIAISKGEAPWEARILKRVEAEKAKKKGKKGGRKSARQSGAGATSEAASSPRAQSHKSPTPVVVESGTKRKFEAVVEIPNGQGRVSPPRHLTQINTNTHLLQKVSAPKTPVTVAQSTETKEPEKSAKRAKSVSEPQVTRKASQASPDGRATTIEQLPKQRLPVAKSLNTDLLSLIQTAVKDGTFKLAAGESFESKSLSVALDIEHAMHTRFGINNVAQYSAQFRSIKHNIKANASLLQQILDGSVTPDELAAMSSEDMASEELQKERQRLKEEADKHATLAHEEGPRYRKTHKGDELIGGDSGNKATESIYKPPVRRGTVEHTPTDVHIDTGSPPPGAELPDDYDRPDQDDEPQSATKPEFNINQVWGSVKPSDPTKAGSNERHVKRPSVALQDQDVIMGDAADDADIDLILKGEDGDNGVPSPAPARDPNTLWSGRVEMKTVAEFASTASWVAGADVGQRIPYHQLLKSGVEIDGRIDIKRANDYVGGMRYSSTTDVCCLALAPSANDADRHGYNSIFNYFKDKNRWGVFAGHGNEAVRDIYLVTVEAGGPEKLPGFVTLLEQSQIDPVRQDNLLLLTLVVRRNPSAPPQSTMPFQQQPHHHPHTPLNQQHPQFSPVAQGTPTFQPHVAISNMAIQILGPYINAPVVTQILSSVTDMTEVQLQNLRDILEREPAARDDIIKLSEHLTQRQRAAEAV